MYACLQDNGLIKQFDLILLYTRSAFADVVTLHGSNYYVESSLPHMYYTRDFSRVLLIAFVNGVTGGKTEEEAPSSQ